MDPEVAELLHRAQEIHEAASVEYERAEALMLEGRLLRDELTEACICMQAIASTIQREWEELILEAGSCRPVDFPSNIALPA